MMSVKWKGLLLFVILGACAPALMAQTTLKGMGLNGSTGLYTVPSGRIGWERTSDLGLDFGYHTIIGKNPYSFLGNDSYRLNHIIKVNASLFKWVELTGAFDVQPKNPAPDPQNNDLLMGFKVQLPTSDTAVAIGGNYQSLNLGNETYDYSAFQLYVAFTYAGTFFKMPAETTVAIGKTFGIGKHYDTFFGTDTKLDFDFGMGFDLILFPNAFKNVVHWIIDYSNFSYSANPWGSIASHRGSLNTGLRIDLAAIPALSKYKFIVDVLLADAFDDERALSLGIVFGLPIL
jgi:hypothetical protein